MTAKYYPTKKTLSGLSVPTLVRYQLMLEKLAALGAYKKFGGGGESCTRVHCR
jgi:hypothetical protein